MAWTEERVELLKKLWAEGLSASQIAGRLGGVTRNAVIGKVHRLGLAGRATSSRSSAPRPRRTHVPRANRAPSLMFGTRGNTALKPQYEAEQDAEPAPLVELVIPLNERASIMTLKELYVPLADRRSGRARVPFLRSQEMRDVALLRASCPHGVSAGAGAPPRETGSRGLAARPRSVSKNAKRRPSAPLLLWAARIGG